MDLISYTASQVEASVFAEKLETDPRDPLFLFSIPHLGTFGVIGMSFQFWIQMFALTLMHVFLNLTASLLAYKFILNQEQKHKAFLVGFGVICPLLVYVPFCMIQVFDLRNPMLRLSAVSSPALVIFHCLETMFGTLPKFATKSFRSFLWYFATTVEFHVDPRTQEVVQVTPQALRQKCRGIAVILCQSVALYSLMVPVDYHLFPRQQIQSLADVFFWGNLCNNYMMGALTKISFEFGLSALGLVVSALSGYSTTSINDYPLTRTSSPSDFWSKRWNTCVSSRLKRAIYRPFRKLGFSKPTAALATFAASGILHEYLLAATAWNSAYEYHLIGSHLLFFIWNAIVLILEGLLRGTIAIRMMEDCLPKPARTALVFMTVLPIVHLFTDQFVALGLYAGGFGLGFPQIRRMG